MENEKNFKKMLEQQKIVVEVINNNKTVNYLLDEKANICSFFEALYRKAVLKANITIRYKNNFTNFQNITIIEKVIGFNNKESKIKYNYYNIPTQHGWLHIGGKLENIFESEVQ